MTKRKKPPMLYQIGTIRSLMAGVDRGDRIIETLTEYGDFGLGTFDGVNGEMMVLDGRFYRADGQGILHVADPKDPTPFAVLTHFDPVEQIELGRLDSLSSIEEKLHTTFESENLIYAIKIEGAFTKLHLRSERRHETKHSPLPETLSKYQTDFSLEETGGTMVGFWFPAYMEAINLPGFHFHFVDVSHLRGGHIYEAVTENAVASIMPIFDFGMHLIHTPLFEHTSLISRA